MICSRCSLGAAMLVEAKRIHPQKSLPIADKTTACVIVTAEDVLGQLGRYMHLQCEFLNCACQHRTNVVEGIDWSKVKPPHTHGGTDAPECRTCGIGGSVNGSGNYDEGATKEI